MVLVCGNIVLVRRLAMFMVWGAMGGDGVFAVFHCFFLLFSEEPGLRWGARPGFSVFFDF